LDTKTPIILKLSWLKDYKCGSNELLGIIITLIGL